MENSRIKIKEWAAFSVLLTANQALKNETLQFYMIYMEYECSVLYQLLTGNDSLCHFSGV
jgi:hypothetical protein